MTWRTLSIFVEEGLDITVNLHGKFAQWELESILMRALEKISQDGIQLNEEEVPTSDEDGKETPD